MTGAFMDRLNPSMILEVAARIQDFPTSGLSAKLSSNITAHHRSFHGKDYKLWAQMCLFVVWPYASQTEREVWLSLTKVLSHNMIRIACQCVQLQSSQLHIFIGVSACVLYTLQSKLP